MIKKLKYMNDKIDKNIKQCKIYKQRYSFIIKTNKKVI